MISPTQASASSAKIDCGSHGSSSSAEAACGVA
jgi:hypothetical protein